MSRSPHYLHNAIFSSGERFPVLLSSEGFPVSLPTRFCIDRLRDKRQSSTIRATVLAISYFYDWAASVAEPFDPEIRLRSGALLDEVECISLQRFLRAKRNPNVLVFPKGNKRLQQGRVTVGSNTLNKQFDCIRKFITWAASCVRNPKASKEELEVLEKRLDAQKHPSTRSADKYGLTKAQQCDLLQIVDPAENNPSNPFNASVRFRNQLIVVMFLETGIRRGELCKIRIENLSLRGAETAFIAIERSPDDPWDTRAVEPNVKTLRRRIPIRKTTKELIFEYLQRHRGRCRNPYLFISSRGGVPLDISAVNRVLQRIRRSSPLFSGVELTPHTMRRTFEDTRQG